MGHKAGKHQRFCARCSSSTPALAIGTEWTGGLTAGWEGGRKEGEETRTDISDGANHSSFLGIEAITLHKVDCIIFLALKHLRTSWVRRRGMDWTWSRGKYWAKTALFSCTCGKKITFFNEMD